MSGESPPKKKTKYKVEIGETFKSRKTTDELFTVKYATRKPTAVDESVPAKAEIAGSRASFEYKSKTGGAITINGSVTVRKEMTNLPPECILIFDEGKFRLERLSMTCYNMKPDKPDKSDKPDNKTMNTIEPVTLPEKRRQSPSKPASAPEEAPESPQWESAEEPTNEANGSPPELPQPPEPRPSEKEPQKRRPETGEQSVDEDDDNSDDGDPGEDGEVAIGEVAGKSVAAKSVSMMKSVPTAVVSGGAAQGSAPTIRRSGLGGDDRQSAADGDSSSGGDGDSSSGGSGSSSSGSSGSDSSSSSG